MLRILQLSKFPHLHQNLQLQRLKYQNFSLFVGTKYNIPNYETQTKYELEKFQKDAVIQGFKVNEIAKIDEMYLTAVRLTHLSTGAQYLHLARDDNNNVFSVGFRTVPMDSTGLPHILEHTTLCGSQRYPCRDPFFKMLRRSLATFMNAMTGPDYTMYPFSTQNLKDFRNLQSVYLDSVFKPNLREIDFRQEGWRLEHADVNDKNSPVIFKGVVFNEMKGVFNENRAILAEQLLNTILPSHTYSVISGGDPLVIPNLKHSDLLDFHRTYYHPSNARIYSYGNFPLEDHLKFINDQYFFLSDRIDTSISEVPLEKRWNAPQKKHITCRPDPMIADSNRQGSIVIGYLLNDITEVQTTFELYVLSQLLLKGPNSAFYKSLIESNLGTSFGSVTGYDAQLRDTLFAVSLQGVKLNDFEKLEKVFTETLHKVIEEGFKKDHIEAVLHGIELQMKHQTSNFGLKLLFNLIPLWNHSGDIVQSMRINEAVAKLVKKMENDPKYLQDMVQKYILTNNHKLTLTMSPDKNYDNDKAIAEQKLLETKLKMLSKNELEDIYIQGQALLTEQKKNENTEVLPTLKIEDLKKDVDRYKLENMDISGVPLQVAVEPTNEVCYYRGILNTQKLPNELKSLLPLFNNIVTKMGTQNHNFRKFDQMIQLKTGGLHFMNHVAEHKGNSMQYEEGILIESYCLDRNVTDMWKLWTELFNNVSLTDFQRFETLVKMTAAQLINGIADSGHIYAMSSAASLVSPIAAFKEALSGLQYVGRMKEVAQLQDLSSVLKQMQAIADFVLNKNHLRSAINVSPENKDSILKSIDTFYRTLKGTVQNPNIITTANDMNTQELGIHYIFPYTVNYSAKAILTVPYTHPEYAILRILSKLITSTYLHPEIREKGGAYGGGAKLTSEGIFTFFSYRDPNSTLTFDVFDGAYEFFKNHQLPQSDIDEAKLGVFQQIDAPQSPCNRGMTQFTHGITDDDIQKHREQLKNVTKEQLMEVAEKYLQPGQKDIKIGRSLIGPNNTSLTHRHSENWTVLDQEEKTQAQAAK